MMASRKPDKNRCMPQNDPEMAKEKPNKAAKTAQDRSKTGPRGANLVQDKPRHASDSPRKAHERPKIAQDTPQEGPQRLVFGFKTIENVDLSSFSGLNALRAPKSSK
jgi:hypothetical protein